MAIISIIPRILSPVNRFENISPNLALSILSVVRHAITIMLVIILPLWSMGIKKLR